MSESTDDQWRHVEAAFGPVKVRGYGAVRRDPNACPRCGSLDPHCGLSEVSA